MSRIAIASSFALFTLFAVPALAEAPVLPHLQLQSTLAERVPSAGLLVEVKDPVPATLHQAMLGEVEAALTDNLVDFEHAIDGPNGEKLAGSGDGSGGLALIAGILGFFPGFGIGHLISGDIGGFLIFLVVDLIIAGVFFVVFPIAIAGVWYIPSVIVIVIERVVEAFSAANAATRDHYAAFEDTAPGTAKAAQALSLDVFRF